MGFTNLLSDEFLTEIDFWRVRVIQGLVTNLNLFLVTLLKRALESRIEFLLFKMDLLRDPHFVGCWSISDQFVGMKTSLLNFDQSQKYMIYCKKGLREY